ncbi:hypothetical protein BDP27DRAFT_1453695, partial [Rhodocollybia butyracea]
MPQIRRQTHRTPRSLSLHLATSLSPQLHQSRPKAPRQRRILLALPQPLPLSTHRSPSSFLLTSISSRAGSYRGCEGCSRGNKAEEMYLYASKNKQPASLCTGPQSVCDAAWGLSSG